MHACVVERYTAVHISSDDGHIVREAVVEHEIVAIDGGLVQAVPLVDIVLALNVDKASIDENLQRVSRSLVDRCKEGARNTLFQGDVFAGAAAADAAVVQTTHIYDRGLHAF